MNTTIPALAVRHAALCLWADAFWDDTAEKAFIKIHGEKAWQQLPRNILDRPLPPMTEAHVDEILNTLLSAQLIWGRLLSEIADEVGVKIEDLCYSICMKACGHGVGPDDYETWPESLECAKIPRIENPAYGELPDTEPFIQTCMIDGSLPRDYSSQWGSSNGTGPLFYNFGGGYLKEAAEYDRTLDAIDILLLKDKHREHDDDLARLYNHVLWERLNRFGRESLTTLKEKIGA